MAAAAAAAAVAAVAAVAVAAVGHWLGQLHHRHHRASPLNQASLPTPGCTARRWHSTRAQAITA